MHDTCRVGDAVGGLQHGAGSSWRSQEVGHGGSCDQGARRGVGQQGRLRVRVATKVWMGPRSVVGAAVGQGERVSMHGWSDVGLWSAVGQVAIPFLMAGTKMLHLKRKSSQHLE